MGIEYRQPESMKQLRETPTELLIDFSRLPRIRFRRTLEHCRLTGSMNQHHVLLASNVTNSEVVDLTSLGVNWHRTDIKDCSIRESRFIRSNFNVSAFINNVVADSTFEQCTFADTSITDTMFIDTHFKSCDLSYVIIKRCTFINCKFDSCKTSNKVLEHCVLDTVKFTKTNIWLATITENFGLSKDDFRGGLIRISDQEYTKSRSVTLLRKHLTREEFRSPLESLRVRYFIEGSLESASEELENSLNMRTWLPLCRIPATFSYLLSGFASFLINLYESNRIPISPLLRLYFSCAQWHQDPPDNDTNVLKSEFQANILSTSMRLLPYFENYLTLTERISQDCFPECVFLVEGPIDKRFYEEFLRETLKRETIVVKKVMPRNSPAEMWVFVQEHVDMLALVALFLACRVKIELRRIQSESLLDYTDKTKTLLLEGESKLQEGKAIAREIKPKRLSFELGMVSDAYRLRLEALFPRNISSSILLEMKLDAIYRVRSVLLEILKPRKPDLESANPQ